MKKLYFAFLFAIISSNAVFSCTGVNPRFTFTNSHTCGIPAVLSFTNTSTGNLSANLTTKYIWRINGIMQDTTNALNAPKKLLAKLEGSNSIELVSIDSTGCRDSFSSTVTVSTNAPKIKDLYGTNTYSPSWLNCIQFRGDSDSFLIKVSSADTLYNAKVIWGDGSNADSTSKLIPGDSLFHYYAKTGIYEYKVILFDSSSNCTDTIYGTVINQRQPTAGIIGPLSGQNKGCAPHSITFKNNSYNVTKETLISWDFGDGKTAEQNAITDPDSIIHTYKEALCNGVVSLKATNICGSSQTTWNPIDISEKDKAKIDVDTNNCDPKEPFIFHNLTADRFCSNPDPKSYYWDFGDGDSTGWIFTKASQTHIYDEPGVYTVMLIAKNGCGLDTTYFTFTAIFHPEPNFTIVDTAGCQPVSTTVTDISKGWGITRAWDFGDGNSSTDSVATNVYTKGGVYTLKLTATNKCSSKDTTFDIEVYEIPIAKLNLKGSGCVPYNQIFTNNSTTFTDSTNYFWNFGDGTSSTDKNPGGKTYTSTGDYDVILKIDNSCGSHSDTSSFEVFGYPVVTSRTDSTVCTFDTLKLSFSANLNSSFTVNWGDGSSSSSSKDDTLPHVYTVDGLKTIIITATGPGGCNTHDTMIVNVKPGALASFTLDKHFACAPAAFNITDLSKNSTNYWWYVDDSLVSTSSLFNSLDISKDSTIKTIKLKTKNAGFCAVDSIVRSVFTAKDPKSSFRLKDSTGCGPLLLSITNTSLNASTYKWSFGASTSSSFEPTITLPASKTKDTNHIAKLISTNWLGCSDSSFLITTVYPLPTVNFSTSNVNGCGPLNSSFTNLSSPNDTGSIDIMTFSWDMGNGNYSTAKNANGVFVASQEQDSIYSVKLIATTEHGCSDSTTSEIIVFPKPLSKFTPSTTAGCGPLEISLSNESSPKDTGSISIMSFDWLINGNTTNQVEPTASFIASESQDSAHIIELVAKSEHGCLDTATHVITVYPKPIAQFSLNSTEGCTPYKPIITNNSTPNDTGDINIMTFNWDLGNRESSTDPNPDPTFVSGNNKDSIYTIKLISISEHGCKDSTFNSITSHPKPVSSFVSDKNNACGPVDITFTNTGINLDSTIWNFYGTWENTSGNPKRNFTPSLLFDTIYNVGISGKSIHGCIADTFYNPLRILGSPKAQFALSKDTSCNEEPTLFYNTSLAAYKYEWDFDDGSSSSLINPTKTFKADNANGIANTYSIKLVATNIFGCSDTASKKFTATPLPTAKIALNTKDGCGDLTINFTNDSKYGKTQKWNFGNGNTSSDANPTFTFTNGTPIARKYVVTLESFANAGCNAIDTATVTIHPKPFINIASTRTDVCDSGGFDFIVKGANINRLDWNFGNGQTARNLGNVGTPIRHYFERSIYGDTNYTTKVIATSINGCEDSLSSIVNLDAQLVANFDQTPDSDCVPALATFTNKSKNATNFVWDFGDGAGSGDTNPIHTYNKAGLYSVKLIAFDKNGCRDIKYGTNNFFARETPIAEFVMSPGTLKLPNAIATFSNLTIQTQPTNYEWDFGDGFTSTIENPVHTYTDSGAYKVKLTAKNSSCQDVIIKQILVDPSLPIVDFDPEGASGCAPLTVNFKEKTQFANKLTWFFGDGQSSTEINPTHVYENDGFYTVTLMAEGPGGVSRIVKTDIIEVKVTPRCYFYGTPDSAFLPNARFDMKNTSINASAFSWEVVNNSTGILAATSTDREPSFIINEKGSYDVTLMARNQNQCHDTLTKPLLLLVLEQGKIFVPTAFTPNRDNINDDFKPVMSGVTDKDYVFRIFNRWGEKIYETTDKKAGWNGTLNGKVIEQNVFIWTISGKFADGTYFTKKGTVTLLR